MAYIGQLHNLAGFVHTSVVEVSLKFCVPTTDPTRLGSFVITPIKWYKLLNAGKIIIILAFTLHPYPTYSSSTVYYIDR